MRSCGSPSNLSERKFQVPLGDTCTQCERAVCMRVITHSSRATQGLITPSSAEPSATRCATLFKVVMRYPLLLGATFGKGKSPADPPGQTTRWHTAQAQLVAHAESIAALAVERSPVRSGDRQPSD